tara:strand:- start:4688 stop:6493 length:1806 start_codon:yes stop_codon:yes gene_type:complete
MARQTINIGTNANDGTGDPLRTAFDKINDNFSELYADSDASTILEHDTAPKLSANLDVNNNQITTDVTNGNVSIQPNGTGNVTIAAIQVQGTSLSSSDSTVINVNDGLIVDGTATVSGALSSATSLALASGATVTGIADEDDMTSNSATLLATQQSIKAYVDTQITAEDLDFSADDSTVLSIDLDSEVLHFAGGTGISTSVSNNTVTHAIDTGTVVTLTDSQTLTNKVLTSPTISSPTITGVTITTSLTTNDITTNGSNANLTLDPQGTGTIELAAATNITGNVNVTGTLTTDDITTAGNHALTGNSTISGTLTVQGTVNADTFISNSNGDITIDPAGTGAIVLTGPITHAGIQTTTGQMNVDNIRIDGNAITATNSNGGINITPDGTGNITLGGNYVAVTNELAAADVAVSSELLLASGAQIVQVATNQDLVLATNGTGAVTTSAQLTLTGSFKRAIHTFTATDSVTETEHAGRTLLLGEVGGNANVVLTMPDATGSGNVYEFIVSVAMGGSTTYKIQAADADNTFSGMVQYLDEDGTAVTAFPTVAASDTITLNSGTQGGLVGDTVTLIDIAANKYAVKGQMRVSAGANPATPFSAAVS